MAEGKFTQDAVLQVVEQTLEPPAAAQGQDAVIWQVTLTGTDLTSQAEAPLRLLKPDQGRAKVWQYENGLWQEVQAEDNGNYLLFSMEGTTGVFCIVSTQGARLLGFLFLGVMAVFALLGVGIRRKKKQSLQTAVLPKEE